MAILADDPTITAPLLVPVTAQSTCFMPRGLTLPEGSPHPTLAKESTLRQMEVLGWLLAYVLYRGDDAHLNLDFSPAVLKVLLHREVTLEDVRSVDESLYNSLEYVLANPGAEAMALSFVDEVQLTSGDGDAGTERVTIELVPGGANMEVNDTNKAEYVHRLVHYRLAGSVMQQVRASRARRRRLLCFVDLSTRVREVAQLRFTWATQVDALRDGLNRLVRVEHLQLFSEAEVALLLAGTSEISVQDWREHTIYAGGYHRSSAQVVWFWQVHSPPLPLRVARVYRIGESCCLWVTGGQGRGSP